MKIVKYLVLFLLLSVNLFAGSVTATYSAGVIPTTYITSGSVTTSSRATNPGLLTVTIPVGAIITSVNVVYNMIATSFGYMSEQRSFIRCTSTSGTDESAVYSGVGNSSGTYAYNRTNLTIANNVTGGGNIQFELHAFRVYGGSGSDSIYNYVNNNSWQITVNYYTVDPPTNFVTTPYTNQIKLSWTKDAANDTVIVAYNTANTFGTLSNGTSYLITNTIPGGGTVIYKGLSTSFYHLGLTPNTPYYYKIWSVKDNIYSTGITGNATTTSFVNSAPVVSNVTFTNNISTTGYVDIYYNVSDAEQSAFTIYMEVSNDGGTTYNVTCAQVTGDIGSGISTGTGKHIIWNFSREHSGESGTNFKIKILADDLVGDQIYYAGKIYNTVTIGSQIWLKENLDVGTMIDSMANPSNNGIIEKYCYGNNPANCTTYGGLYQWNEAMQYVTTSGTKGICPTGWHIPTNAELLTLGTTANNNSNALTAVGQGTGSSAGTNTSGFSALLAGVQDGSGVFHYLGNYTFFWSSTNYNATNAYGMILGNSDSGFNYYDKVLGSSVRCVKN